MTNSVLFALYQSVVRQNRLDGPMTVWYQSGFRRNGPDGSIPMPISFDWYQPIVRKNGHGGCILSEHYSVMIAQFSVKLHVCISVGAALGFKCRGHLPDEKIVDLSN